MKCVGCEQDSNYKDRGSTGTCSHCGRRFVFEPVRGDPITDMMMHRTLAAVSAQGEVAWLPENVFYGINSRLYRNERKSFYISSLIGCVGVVAGGSYFLQDWFGLEWWIAALGLLIAYAIGFLVVARIRLTPTLRLDRAKFEQLWRRWESAADLPDRQVTPGFAEEQAGEQPPPAEFESYSFDRVLICESPAMVDLLVANNFHFENSCPVITADGYPSGPFERIRSMLAQNPDLKTYVLHDATIEGCGLVTRLRSGADWFRGSDGRVEDVGLRPRDAKIVAGCFQRAHAVAFSHLMGELRSSERKWLTRYSAELLALRPAALMRRSFAVIAGASAGASGEYLGSGFG